MKTRLLLLTPLVALGAILVLAQQRPAAGAKLDLSEAAKEIQFPRKGWTDQTPAEGAKSGQKQPFQFETPGAANSSAYASELASIRAALGVQSEYMKGLRAHLNTLEQQVVQLQEHVARLEQKVAAITTPATPNNN